MDGLSIATPILTRAVTLDNESRYTESLVCYQEGISILMETLKSIPDDVKRGKIKLKTEEYMVRAEKVKQHIEALKNSGKYREQTQVAEDAVGFSYKAVFYRFLAESSVQTVEIDDPYIRSPHQCDNLIRFLELCIRLCPKLKSVKLTTGKDVNNSADQNKRLETIRASLFKIPGRSSLDLEVQYSDSLHDREIRFDNGWVIKIGRGLDYFKPIDRYHIGWSDFDLRPCRATTIDVFHKKELEKVH